MELKAATRLVTAEGEWFDMLSDEMKKMYIEEHPDSKYAKGYRLSNPGQPSAPGKPPAPGAGPATPPAKVQQPGPKLDNRSTEQLKKLPKSAQKFVKSGGTKKNSKARKQSAEQVRAAAPKLARGILKDSVGVVSGLTAMHRMLEFKPKEGDYKKAASLVMTVLGTGAMMAALGATGPAGFLAFMAIKHVAAPALYNVVKEALAPDVKQKKQEEPEFGYWKDDNTWVPLTEDEYDSLTDDDVDEYRRTGKDPHGKFQQFENRGMRTFDDADNDEAENVDFRDTHAALRLASVVTATDDEKQLTSLINAISDYVESGDIPDKAWAAAIDEAAGMMKDE
jgi:hypothetical protein